MSELPCANAIFNLVYVMLCTKSNINFVVEMFIDFTAT